jgi:hypothetical protein
LDFFDELILIIQSDHEVESADPTQRAFPSALALLLTKVGIFPHPQQRGSYGIQLGIQKLGQMN